MDHVFRSADSKRLNHYVMGLIKTGDLPTLPFCGPSLPQTSL
jgi:hypothetical protein